MLKLHSWSGPYMDIGDDYPHLEINVQVGEDSNAQPVVHWAAIQVSSWPIIEVVLPMLQLLGVPEKQLEGCTPVAKDEA